MLSLLKSLLDIVSSNPHFTLNAVSYWSFPARKVKLKLLHWVRSINLVLLEYQVVHFVQEPILRHPKPQLKGRMKRSDGLWWSDLVCRLPSVYWPFTGWHWELILSPSVMNMLIPTNRKLSRRPRSQNSRRTGPQDCVLPSWCVQGLKIVGRSLRMWRVLLQVHLQDNFTWMTQFVLLLSQCWNVKECGGLWWVLSWMLGLRWVSVFTVWVQTESEIPALLFIRIFVLLLLLATSSTNANWKWCRRVRVSMCDPWLIGV